MKFVIDRQSIYRPLQKIVGIISSRPRIPILSHVLLEVNDNYLYIIATNLEIEMVARVVLGTKYSVGSSTVSGRKFFEIFRNLSGSSDISVILKDNKLIVCSGSSKFSLSTFPTSDFPKLDKWNEEVNLVISEIVFKKMIELTHFSMGYQDVRYYLNGILFETQEHTVRMVATDGHRLAICEVSVDDLLLSDQSIIIPRKSITEILRLLHAEKRLVNIQINTNSIRIQVDNYIVTSKVIDAVFPNYNNIFCKESRNILKVSSDVLKNALKRVSILSNEKLRIVKFALIANNLIITAYNLEHETSEEVLDVLYSGEDIEISFNVDYLLDILCAMNSCLLKFFFTSATSSIQIEEESGRYGVKYVVMPVRV